MHCTVEELAARVGGHVLGDATRTIANCAAVERATAADLTFITNAKNARRLTDSQAGAACVPSDLAEMLHERCPQVALIVVADAQGAFLRILTAFRPAVPREEIGVSPAAHVHPTAQIGGGTNVHPTAVIGAGAVIGADCEIHPGAVIGAGCAVGDQSILHPHVVLYPGVQLGSRVELHAGAVIGARGFGYAFVEGRFEPIPQLGSVEIGDDVEIGACTTIDRGAIGPTTIGEGSKIDNLVMIAHNCEIGRHNVFASQVGLAGSVQTQDYVRMAGQVGVCDHATLGAGCTVGAKSGVAKSIPAGETWVGYPALPEQEQKRNVFIQKRLPEMRDRLKQLEKEVEKLRAALADDDRQAA